MTPGTLVPEADVAERCPVHNLWVSLWTACPHCLEDTLREAAEWDELMALAEGRL